jgi:hypothetical protein
MDRYKWVTDIKAEFGCVLCGEDCVVCLEFHHLDGRLKDGEISAVRKDKILEEIDKCIIVCKNCHAMIHAGLIVIDVPGFCYVHHPATANYDDVDEDRMPFETSGYVEIKMTHS